MMQIYYIIKLFIFQIIDYLFYIIVKKVAFIYIRISFNEVMKTVPGKKVNFSSNQLFFKTSYHGSCENDIADRT